MVLKPSRFVSVTSWMARKFPFPANAEDAARCEPIYEELPGWKENTIGTKSLDALPENAQVYIRRIEELVGRPVDMVSTGPDREETLVLRHPFRD